MNQNLESFGSVCFCFDSNKHSKTFCHFLPRPDRLVEMSSGLRTGVSAVTRTRTGRSELEDIPPTMDQDRGRSRPRQTRAPALEDTEIESLPNISALRNKFQGGATVAKFSRPNSALLQNADQKKPKPEVGEVEKPVVRDQLARPNAGGLETDKFFETTNHTERFKYTRAIFAQMEQQNEKEKDTKSHFQRSKSPTRYQVITPNNLVLSPIVIDNNGSRLNSPLTPSQLSVSTSKPASSKFDFHQSAKPTESGQNSRTRFQSATELNQPSSTAQGTSSPSLTGRASSVDNLDNDLPAAELGRMSQSRQSSKSESDLASTRSFGEDAVPSPKWIIQHYDEVVKGSAVQSGGATRSRTPSETQNSGTSNSWQKSVQGSVKAETPPVLSAEVPDGKLLTGTDIRRATRSGLNDRPASQGQSGVGPEVISGNRSAQQNQNNRLSDSNAPSTNIESSTSHSSQPTHSRGSYVSATAANFRPARSGQPETTAIKNSAAVIKTSISGESDQDAVADRLAAWKSRRRQPSDTEKVAAPGAAVDSKQLESQDKSSVAPSHFSNRTSNEGSSISSTAEMSSKLAGVDEKAKVAVNEKSVLEQPREGEPTISLQFQGLDRGDSSTDGKVIRLNTETEQVPIFPKTDHETSQTVSKSSFVNDQYDSTIRASDQKPKNSISSNGDLNETTTIADMGSVNIETRGKDFYDSGEARVVLADGGVSDVSRVKDDVKKVEEEQPFPKSRYGLFIVFYEL